MIRHLHRHLTTMIEALDALISTHAPWLDALALFVVCGIALKRPCVISLVVLLDFALVFFGQDWLQSLTLWGSLGLDYQYSLGIKDTLIAVNLLLLAANPWLVIAYIIPAILSWSLWASYKLGLEYNLFLQCYYAWSPLYALCMIPQIYGLSRGNSDAGKRIRRKLVPAGWDRFFQPVSRFAHADITTFNPTTKKDFG